MSNLSKQLLFLIGCVVGGAIFVGGFFGLLIVLQDNATLDRSLIGLLAAFGAIMGAIIALVIMIASGFGKHNINF